MSAPELETALASLRTRVAEVSLDMIIVELSTNLQEVSQCPEKAPTRAFSLLKAATTAFTFKTLLIRHFAKQALTPRSLNVKLGPRRNYHKGRAVWLA